MQPNEPATGNLTDAADELETKRVAEAARLIALERSARANAALGAAVGKLPPKGKKNTPAASWASKRKAQAKRAKRSRKRNR